MGIDSCRRSTDGRPRELLCFGHREGTDHGGAMARPGENSPVPHDYELGTEDLVIWRKQRRTSPRSWHEGQGCRGGADGNGEVLRRARRTTLRAPIHSKKRCGGCSVFQRSKSSGARLSGWGDRDFGPSFGNGGSDGGRRCCSEGEGSGRGEVDAACVRRVLAPFIEGERAVGGVPRSSPA